ncbi:hypothetical protein CHLNCDRAFT_55097 [Chlorella variabilis]|uniref:Uncharacterized protein n=1 Tax=Chlorella variabilis TaxID=554065 RepID=E1ZRS8_CHLVA|nr:hypothetical protein CHLNCDRAFT_55097 [Chlorella variabilis]EFN51514.1 hypothetical protein CHLNCDRAFT_55097 [Chlorella variabilis]|eukprot:XP_005843616.1 hypothetical protein CHLNCDRAFT_55097 [Chlorella variabilis]
MQRYGRDLQNNLMAEQQHVLNNALHSIQATITEKAGINDFNQIMDAKAKELRHEVVKRDKEIEARDKRIEVQQREFKELSEKFSNITSDLLHERDNIQKLRKEMAELTQQVDDDVLGDKEVFRRALTPELLGQATTRLTEARGIVMYFKNEEKSEKNTAHINELTIQFMKEHIPNLSVMDLSAFAVPPYHRWLWHPERKLTRVTAGFKLKVLALYAAPYKEVLLLDAETLPTVTPEALFDNKDTFGAAFYVTDKAEQYYQSAKVIDSDRCHYNFSDFQADKQRCQVAYDFAKSGEKDTPPVWKVPEGSLIQKVQHYAYEAFLEARVQINKNAELFAK